MWNFYQSHPKIPYMKIYILFTMVSLLPVQTSAANDLFRKMAKELSRSVGKKSAARIGILAFPYHDGRISSGSSIVSERLTTELASQRGMRVVERSLVRKLLEEQRLSETGVIDPGTAKEMGKILGIDMIVTGTLIELNDEKTEVNARLLKADTGEVISASRATIQTSWNDRPRIAQPFQTRSRTRDVPEEDKSAENEAIRIGIPGRGGRGGYYR